MIDRASYLAAQAQAARKGVADSQGGTTEALDPMAAMDAASGGGSGAPRFVASSMSKKAVPAEDEEEEGEGAGETVNPDAINMDDVDDDDEEDEEEA